MHDFLWTLTMPRCTWHCICDSERSTLAHVQVTCGSQTGRPAHVRKHVPSGYVLLRKKFMCTNTTVLTPSPMPPNKETSSNQDCQNQVSEITTPYQSVHYCGTRIPISLTHRTTPAEPPMPDLVKDKHTTKLVTRYVCKIELDG